MSRIKVVNGTEQSITLKEGIGGIFRTIKIIPKGKKHYLEVDQNETYKEYLCIFQGNLQVARSSDDFIEYKEVKIMYDERSMKLITVPTKRMKGTGDSSTGRVSKTSDQSSKTSDQSSKTGGELEKASGQSGKTGGELEKASGQSGKTGGELDSGCSKTSVESSKSDCQLGKTNGQSSEASGNSSNTSGQPSRIGDQSSKTDGESDKTSRHSGKGIFSWLAYKFGITKELAPGNAQRDGVATGGGGVIGDRVVGAP